MLVRRLLPSVSSAALLILIGCHASSAQPSPASSASVSRADRSASFGGTATRTIEDPVWHMTAALATIPAGWRFAGTTSHGESCISTVPDVRYAVASPDGTVEIQYFPQISYSWSNDPQSNARNQQAGCLLTQFFRPEDFLTRVVAPQLHPGAHFEVHTLPNGPAIAQRLAEAAQQDRQGSRAGTSVHTDVSLSLIGFDPGPSGPRQPTALVGIFTCTQTTFANTGLRTAECHIDNAMLIQAPEAQIASLLNNPVVHASLTPAWEQQAKRLLDQRFAAQNQAAQAMFQRDRNAQTATHNALMNGQQQQFEAGQKVAAAQAQATHNAAVGTSQAMSDTTTFGNANGGKVDLSTGYAHTDQNTSAGTYLQTTSQYAPGPGTVWQELQPR